MKIHHCACLLTLIAAITGSGAQAEKSSVKPKANLSKAAQTQAAGAPSDTILIKPNRKGENSGTKQHAMNTFTDIQQSMPTQAVKDELARKHALPGQQTSVLTPGDSATSSVSSPSINNASTGAAPSIQSGSGMAIPQPTGSSFGTFK